MEAGGDPKIKDNVFLFTIETNLKKTYFLQKVSDFTIAND